MDVKVAGWDNKEAVKLNQTLQIETGKSIRFENVASFRKKMKESEIQMSVGKFINDLKQSGAQKNGPMITATFGMEEINGERILDMEFLVPLDRSIELNKEYIFKPIFHLMHAIYTRHVGKSSVIQKTYTDLIEYIRQNRLQQITVAYNVNDDNVRLGDDQIIDVYIGVNPSVL